MLKINLRGLSIGQKTRKRFIDFLGNKKGEFVSTIGWMAIVTTVLVLVHGLLTGWLPGFVEQIFSRMEQLV